MRAAFFLCLPLAWLTNAWAAETSLSNERYRVELQPDRSVQISSGTAGTWTFRPDFTVLVATQNPAPAMRPGNVPQVSYNVVTWQAEGLKAGAQLRATKRSTAQAGDGFDDQILNGETAHRTVDVFASAPKVHMEATTAAHVGTAIRFGFPESAAFTLSAELSLPAGNGEPALAFTLVPKQAAWFSVGYTGAPAFPTAEFDEIWQPFIWQEKRFPGRSYLTPAFECPLPATLVRRGEAVLGVIVDPDEFPFDPLPTLENSRFGVALRNPAGEAQPMVFAPLLGGAGSQREAGQALTFTLRLYVAPASDLTVAYESLARGLYRFRDFRRNDLCSLNTTLDNMIEYGLSRYSWFVDELKGCAYSTDVPGAVKNVSSLNPLELALVTDDEEIFQKRAYPIVEFMLSREKFLFSLDPKQKIQSPSRALTGPCAPLSELAALYGITHGASPLFRRLAEQEMGRTRTLNLDDVSDGASWPNQLAMYQETGEARFLEAARHGADAYLEERVSKPATAFAGRGFFFWPPFVPDWIDLFRLYEATGDKRYLTAAQRGARQYTMFTWMSPRVPDGGIRVNPAGNAPVYPYMGGKGHHPMHAPEAMVPAWRLSEIGLTPESSGTMSGHRGIFMANFSPWMLRIAALTDDTLLHDVARSAIVGRYRNFPGYHINTARTDIYERTDYPLHDFEDLSVNSFHYNHIWPHMSILLNFLVTDAFARSGGQIDFPSHFIEGYAYLQDRFYGDRPGKFYGHDDAYLWLPRHVLETGSVELNYLTARGDGRLYVALTNQSAMPVSSELTVNSAVLPPAAKGEYGVIVLGATAEGRADAVMRDGRLRVTVPPHGLLALAVEGLTVTPKFQQKIQGAGATQAWREDCVDVPFGHARAMVLNFGAAATTAYVYLRDDDSHFRQASLTYRCGGEAHTLTDTRYPFEFTVPLPEGSTTFEFELAGVTLAGTTEKSTTATLRR